MASHSAVCSGSWAISPSGRFAPRRPASSPDFTICWADNCRAAWTPTGNRSRAPTQQPPSSSFGAGRISRDSFSALGATWAQGSKAGKPGFGELPHRRRDNRWGCRQFGPEYGSLRWGDNDIQVFPPVFAKPFDGHGQRSHRQRSRRGTEKYGTAMRAQLCHPLRTTRRRRLRPPADGRRPPRNLHHAAH
jgi:hypothetical protein